MFHARVKKLRKAIKKWWRERQDLTSKVSRLQNDVDDLRLRLEVTTAFYERRLDAALDAMLKSTEKHPPKHTAEDAGRSGLQH